jgi:group II intron reverse transcriptase/maturase
MIMPSYQFGIKTLSPNIIRNKYIRSGDESHLRGQVFLKNSWRVTVFMVRVTKLPLHAHLPLDINFITCNKLFGLWLSSRMYGKSMITDPEHCYQQIYVKQRPNYTYGGILGTMRHPKGRKPYGGGDSVRESGFRRFSSVTNINEQSCVGLKDLIEINKNNVGLVNNKLIHIVADPKVLILAYEIIKSKPGNMTRGVDSTTLDNIDLNWVVTVSQQLKAGKYKFNPARRVYISKPGKKEKIPLTISSPRDKVVQQAIYLVLNAIYEPSFLDASHGFRSNKGTHTALKDVKLKFQGVKWCIKADIENNFPNIDHKILLTLLGKRISCPKFLALVKKSIKAGYMEDKKFVVSNKGLFIGNVTSPILNNIYLHQLDLFMSDLIESFNKGKNRKKSPAFRRIQYLMEKSTGNITKLKKFRKELWKINSKDPFDPNFKRLYYIRYVDDFVVGVVGSYQDTAEIRNKIDEFLKNKLKLTLSSEKSSITHFSKKPIFFLSTFIKGNWEKTKKLLTIKKQGSASRKVRMTSRVVLKAPIESIFEKATQNGFFKVRQGQFIPTKVGRCINLDHQDILRYYNSVIRGVLNYYSFANNRKSLGSFIHGLKLSCARTLALKYKLRHASKIYRKFGPKLKSPDGSVELYIPSTFKAIKKFSYNVPIPEDVILSNWNNKLTKSNLFKPCVICGSIDQIQMHHVREIKDLKSKAGRKTLNFFTLQMAAINRKQVPLCSAHHKALHNNTLSISERELFKNNIKSL